jgi:hypothetical protein
MLTERLDSTVLVTMQKRLPSEGKGRKVNIPDNMECKLKPVINIKFQSMYPTSDWTVCWC